MKKLYTFSINNEEEIEIKEQSTNEKGEKVEVTKKEKKSVAKQFFIKKPTRLMFDEAELFYHVAWSEGVKAGMLPRALLIKRFSNDGGVLSKTEQDKFVGLYEKLYKQQNEFQRLTLKTEADRTEEEKETYKGLIKEISTLQIEIEDFEQQQSALFQNTPEYRARNRTILWWVLNLSFSLNDKNEELAVFGDGDFEQKVKKYDEISESEEELKKESKEYITTAIKKMFLLISFWYTGKAVTENDFAQLDKIVS